jgi:hypothetical protein
MKRRRALTISILAVVALAAAAVAVAANRHAPRVDPVLATFSFAAAHEKQRFCTGEDGPYIEIRAHHEGTQTGDPRLTGKLELEAHNLVNLATGLGTSEGTFTLRDPATNALKVKGKYHGIFTEGSKFHGLSTGSVKDPAGESETIALFKADVDLATGVVSGELGGASADPRTPAVISRGACTGPWTTVGR